VRLLSLSLEQFRNYQKLELAFPESDIHLFVGPNGAGKTNILEAVALLSLNKSFLGLDEEDLLQWGSEFYRVRGKVRTDTGIEEELEIVSQWSPRKRKACFVNGVKVATASMVGRLPMVTFLPQDIALFSGPPAERRGALDQLLSQVSTEYYLQLLEYHRLLKQRNSLLRAIADGAARESDLEPWDEALCEKGAFVTSMRLELIETFNVTLENEVRALGERWEEVRMVHDASQGPSDREGIKQALRTKLKECLPRDLLLQTTGAGPHRDDWTICVKGRPLFSFASRGQQRVAALALLFLEASYLEIRRGEKPVVLLDDIFSELDSVHREKLLSSFAGHQVLLTATEVPLEGAGGGLVRQIREGTVLE
jgi:DNA replication and repair protein RecF